MPQLDRLDGIIQFKKPSTSICFSFSFSIFHLPSMPHKSSQSARRLNPFKIHILSECKLYFKLFIVFKKRLQLSQATRLALLMPQVSPGELQDVNEARR